MTYMPRASPATQRRAACIPGQFGTVMPSMRTLDALLEELGSSLYVSTSMLLTCAHLFLGPQL